MFKTYRIIKSPIQTLQKHVEEIVNVWCDANGDFSVELFKDADLKELVENIEINNPKGKHDRRWKHEIEDIFNLFKALNSVEREEIRGYFKTNNQIERLCRGELQPVKYSNLPKVLQKPLKDFFNDLYNEILKRKPFENKYETVKNYFDALMKSNRGLTVCPFCALVDLKSQFDDGRDAFDHYFPKGTYPFISVNFLNLAPICYPCNSGAKLSEDPLFENGVRRRVFFPFGGLSIDPFSIQIELKNDNLKLEAFKKDDIEVTLKEDELVKNWDRVFGISGRYNAKICQKIKEWLKDWQNTYRRKKGKIELKDFIEDRLYEYQDRPLHERYFLKYAIFNALNEHNYLAQSLEEAITTS